jgi:ribosome-associated protein
MPVKRKKPPIFETADSAEKATLLSLALSEKQARDVTVLDVHGHCPVADFIVVCTAKNPRHGRALADAALDRLGERKLEYLGMEGYRESDWVLLDANDVIVHIFQEETRRYYNIEGLWPEAARSTVEAPRPEAAPAEAHEPESEAPQVEVAKPKVARPKAATAKPKAATARTSKPKSDKPKAAKPKTAKPKSDKPKSDKPKSDKPKSDKPKTSKPKASKPRTAKPKGAGQ